MKAEEPSTDKKRKKRPVLLLAGLVFAALVACVLLSTLREMTYESVASEQVEINRAVESFSCNAAALDRYLRQQYPEDCAGKALTHATLDAALADGELRAGTLCMEYYRYIDESREGGNIEATRFCFDVVQQKLVEIIRESGSGRTLSTVFSEPVLESVAAFPLTQYIDHFDALTDVPADAPVRLLIDVACRGLRAQVFYDETTQGFDYCEIVREYVPGTPFSARESERIERGTPK